ncbi:acyltransferase [Faecalibaculum rodentium]|uniref:Acetyltransferase n=1 Tax=Faecalibaculum rodentium TaxID=1702221 RepID=A0A140DXK2_9FIRM|nr:acyltransferase [Faecalibaculum rodentium]AMK55379.1 acetyltransferase [Faecalibaculum rodentium]
MKYALIGCGRISPNHIQAAGNNGLKIAALCDLDQEVAIRLIRQFELEDHVFCGPSCVFTNVLTPRSRYPRRAAAYARTLVKEGASIGANATVLCGHTIGRHALIAAGAVVTCDVGDHALMSGIPARQTGWVCECGTILPDTLRCPECGRQYQPAGTGLKEVQP